MHFDTPYGMCEIIKLVAIIKKFYPAISQAYKLITKSLQLRAVYLHTTYATITVAHYRYYVYLHDRVCIATNEYHIDVCSINYKFGISDENKNIHTYVYKR